MKCFNCFAVLTAILIFGGCNDFIDIHPDSFNNTATFYNDSTGVLEGLSGAYSTLQSVYGTGTAFWTMAEERSDNTTFEYNVSNRGAVVREQMDYFQITPDNSFILGVWKALYAGIAQCNMILDHIAEVQMSATGKDHIKGQAEFIRGLYYFNLVRLFGGVPLVVASVLSPEDAFAKNGRASAEEVYQQIEKDVTDAAARLPAAWPETQSGRATQGAAYTLLGEMYLTRRDFASAIELFEKVTELGYSLLPDYNQLYDTQHKNSPESVFEVQFTTNVINEGSGYLHIFAPLGAGKPEFGDQFTPTNLAGRNIPTRDMIGFYGQNDKRKAASIAWFISTDNHQYDEAQGDSVPYVKKYAFPPAQPNEQDVDFYVYRYAQVLLWLAEAYNESGQSASAGPLVDQIRKRAGLSPLPPGLDQAALRVAIRREQRIESAFEDHRWFDLLRYDRAVEVMRRNGTVQKKYQKWLPSSSYDVQAYMLLYPIPKIEIDLNHLKQNPGW